MGKALAMVTTSIVHCYPDGLLSSDVQYTSKHFPIQRLHSFEVNKSSSYLVEQLDGDVLRSLIISVNLRKILFLVDFSLI